jgi:hypothetical protein
VRYRRYGYYHRERLVQVLMGGAEQGWLLKAKLHGYSDALCRTYAHHAPARHTTSREPFLGIITIAISI